MRLEQTIPTSIYDYSKGLSQPERIGTLPDEFVDGHGHLWIYTHDFIGTGNYMPGFFIAADKLVHWPTIKGMPAGLTEAAAPVDKDTVWVFVQAKGIYAVDLRTMTARRARNQLPKSVIDALTMNVCGGRVYVVTYVLHGAGRKFDLWRYQNQTWTDCVQGIDVDSDGYDLLERSFISSRAGVWISSMGNGFWLDPGAGRPAVQVNWQRGFQRWCRELVPISGGRILYVWLSDAYSQRRGYSPISVTRVLPDRVPPLRKPASGGWMLVRADGRAAVTTKGVAFFNATSGFNTFEIWDGSRMRHVAYPHVIAAVNQEECLVDDRDRYWPLPDDADHEAGYYDLQTGKWRVFDTLKDAVLTTYRESGPWKFTSDSMSQPAFTADGRVAIRVGETIYYYDGKSWCTWKLADIDRQTYPGSGVPTFTDDGKPVVSLSAVYTLTDGKWIKTGSLTFPLEPPHRTAPPNCPVNASVVAYDESTGVYWYVYNGQLYRQLGKIYAPALPADGATPFSDGETEVSDSFEDSAGNTWLWSSRIDYIMIPRPAPRAITITVKHTAVDSVSITFSNSEKQPLKYIWRVNGAAWSDPDPAGPHDLTLLPAGTYTVEVRSIDRYAAPDPKPTSTTFTIVVDTASQIKGLIHQLTAGTDAARNQALTALTCQPKAALPALNAALAASTDDKTTFWINAAVQACEQAQDSGKDP